MKSPEKIIESGDTILLDVSTIDKRIYTRILKFLAENSVSGKISISNENLAILEDIIYEEIKKTDYSKNIGNFLTLFTALENSISQEQAELNRLKAQEIKDLWRGNELRERMIQKVVYDLGAQGMKNYFVKGLSEVVRDANYFNLTIDDAVIKLNKVLIDDEYTKRYIRQTAQDSLAQYDGAINDAVRDTYGFDKMIYSGNTIETTRPICAHIRDDYDGRLTSEQLKSILDKYCPNGIPSEKRIIYQTVSGDDKSAKMGSGMIEGTRFENFSQLRGGYGCRHRVLWTDRFIKKK